MNRIESINVVPTTPRQSTPGRFDAALQNAANHLARTVAGGLELAAPAVPGGTFLLGAIRAATQPAPGSAPVAAAAPFVGGNALAGSTLASGVGASGVGTSAGTTAAGETDVMASARALQAESQAYNAQYLQLQEAMQKENREFTALSKDRTDPGATGRRRRPQTVVSAIALYEIPAFIEIVPSPTW